MANEQDLLQRARQLDQDALAEIYDLYSDDLFRYTMRAVGDVQMAEDCVAETFRRFLQALNGGGGPKKHIRAYLYQIVRNWITDYYRKNQPVMVALDKQPLPIASKVTHELKKKDQADRIRRALRALTSEQRQVILLKYYEGWSNAEVANVIEKPVGAVKSLQNRGLNALKRILVGDKESLL